MFPACGADRLSSVHRPGAVVIFLVDTLRLDRMSAYGARRETTPAAQRLAAEGVRYDAAYSVSTWTRPSVAALFTSRLPAEVGAVDRVGELDTAIPTMAEMFRRAGRRTASFCGNPNIFDPALGFGRGFDAFAHAESPRSKLPPGRLVADLAIAWVEAQRDSNFFVFVHVVDPHAPYDHFLPGHRGLFRAGSARDADALQATLEDYDALIRQSDDEFARLRSELERKGFWRDALVVYVADHGEQFLEHGGGSHGDTLFEETLRVPLIVKGPRWGRAGQIVGNPVSLLDLLPSLAHWGGLPADPKWEGTAIDAGAPDAARELYYSEELDGWRLYGLRRGSRKVIVSMNPPFRVEFDLSVDPGEQRPRDADVDLARRLERLRVREIMSLGGLQIHRIGSDPFRLVGRVTGLDPRAPFLLWSDRGRFRVDASSPEALYLDRRIARAESFDLHVARFDGKAQPSAQLAPAPIEILTGATTALSAAEVAETTKRMRNLGYLGGH